MRYFIDTEFIESFHKPLFDKKRHFIDLISIGIVCENGGSYYAISKEVNYDDASDWVKTNVLNQIVRNWVISHSGDQRNWALDRIQRKGNKAAFDFVKNEIGKANSTISLEIKEFCDGSQILEFAEKDINFYGYYSDYDWVLFCSLFGTMMDLPKAFPMYCIDLKQTLDEKTLDDAYWGDRNKLSLEKRLNAIKESTGYPKQNNEHNALADAKWNFELYKFLQTF